MSTDQFQAHDYYLMDELLSDEHKLIRETARAWVKKEVSPIIEEHYESNFPSSHIKGVSGNWWFWSLYPRRIWWSRIRSDCLWNYNARIGKM